MKIKSPITNSDNTMKVETLNSNDIISSYIAAGWDNIKRFFVNDKTVSIYKCLDTGYRFYHPSNIAGDDDFYTYLQKKNGYYANWRWEHGIASNEVGQTCHVLENGCGSGNFLERLREDKKIHGVGLELCLEAANNARSKGSHILSETIEKHAEKNKDKYDIVCAFQVLEHVYDVKSFIEGSLACLKKGGLLIIGVPNNNPYIFKYDKLHALNLPPHHMGLWDKKSLKSLKHHFPMLLKYVATEPLFDTDYFWKISTNHWKNNNPVVYWFSQHIPDSMKDTRNKIIRKVCAGRNLLAVYIKD